MNIKFHAQNFDKSQCEGESCQHKLWSASHKLHYYHHQDTQQPRDGFYAADDHNHEERHSIINRSIPGDPDNDCHGNERPSIQGLNSRCCNATSEGPRQGGPPCGGGNLGRSKRVELRGKIYLELEHYWMKGLWFHPNNSERQYWMIALKSWVFWILLTKTSWVSKVLKIFFQKLIFSHKPAKGARFWEFSMVLTFFSFILLSSFLPPPFCLNNLMIESFGASKL